jgi:multicomponent Na+:H+ antiporter subunit D
MNLVILPILIPVLTALVAILMGRPSVGRRWVVGVSAVLQLGVALFLLWENLQGRPYVLGVGYWTYPALLYTFAEGATQRENPLRMPLMQMLVVGINLSFATGDMFNLFVAFEVMLLASYALMTLETDNYSVKHAFPYLAVNLAGGTLFLCAAGLAYGLFGTLNFADIGVRAAGMTADPRLLALVLLLMVVFCTKAGLFPLFYWLPNSYPILPVPLAALFSAMLTKVGVYVLLRGFGSVMPDDLSAAHQLLVVLAGLTMVLAIIGAVARSFVRGILAFNLLSHIGFMALAVGLFTPESVGAAIYYIMHHILVMASLFLITGAMISLNRTDHLPRMGNLWKKAPWLGVLFLVQAMSLSGIPPLSGFWGKYLILEALLKAEAYWLVVAVLLASILTLLSMIKVWNGAFWTARPEAVVNLEGGHWRSLAWIAAGVTVFSLFMGLGAEWFLQVAFEADRQVMDKGAYADLVFGVLGKGGN